MFSSQPHQAEQWTFIKPPLYRTKCTTLHSECGWSLAETVADSCWSFEIHLADTGHSRHHNFAVEVVLHGIFTEEQVDLIIIAVLALKTLLHKVQVNKVWFWNYEEKSLFTLNCAWDYRGFQRGGTHRWARSSWTQCAESGWSCAKIQAQSLRSWWTSQNTGHFLLDRVQVMRLNSWGSINHKILKKYILFTIPQTKHILI